MPITLTSVRRIDAGCFEFTVSPSTEYDVWLQGARVTANVAATETTYIYDGWTDDDEPPPLEFVDYGETPDSGTYSPRGILQWWGDTAVDYYSIERYVDSAWASVANILGAGGGVWETGGGYYQYRTVALADGSTPKYRVVPYDSEGNSGTPLEYTIQVVCYPVPPVIDVTYDAVNTELDVTART